MANEDSRVAWALAVLEIATARLRRMEPGNPPMRTLSDIPGYEQAASRVIHFLLHPKEYRSDEGDTERGA